MNYKDIAEYCGVTERYIRMIFTGDRDPSLKIARKISEYIGKPIEDIFFNSETNFKFDSEPKKTA